MTAYYNEFDPYIAAWLRELIAEGVVANGDVDERSIADVSAIDLVGYSQCHFFAGVAGWSAALRLAGWPDDKPVWTGSCPCQPFSCAGKGDGINDKRHLWPEFFRLIRECRPGIVFGEQVENAIGHGWLDGISDDLEAEGYACGPVVLPACCVGAPHRRYRLFWGAVDCAGSAAYDQQFRPQGQCEDWTTQSAVDGRYVGRTLANGQHSESRTGNTSIETIARIGRHRPTDTGISIPLAHGVSAGRRRRGDGHDARDAGNVQIAGQCGDDTVSDNESQSQYRKFTTTQSAKQKKWRESGVHSINCDATVAILCADGKYRRVPALESGIQLVADGFPPGLADLWTYCDQALYPLAEKVDGDKYLLHGAGNAIVPAVAAEFIQAYCESIEELNIQT